MKICFVYSNRAEYSILSSFITLFKLKTIIKTIDLQKIIPNLDYDQNLYKIYQILFKDFSKQKFDYVIILGDRREIPFVCLACVFSNTKIIHLGAGETLKGIPTYDQFFRPMISLLSNYQICFSKSGEKNIKKL